MYQPQMYALGQQSNADMYSTPMNPNSHFPAPPINPQQQSQSHSLVQPHYSYNTYSTPQNMQHPQGLVQNQQGLTPSTGAQNFSNPQQFNNFNTDSRFAPFPQLIPDQTAFPRLNMPQNDQLLNTFPQGTNLNLANFNPLPNLALNPQPMRNININAGFDINSNLPIQHNLNPQGNQHQQHINFPQNLSQQIPIPPNHLSSLTYPQFPSTFTNTNGNFNQSNANQQQTFNSNWQSPHNATPYDSLLLQQQQQLQQLQQQQQQIQQQQQQLRQQQQQQMQLNSGFSAAQSLSSLQSLAPISQHQAKSTHPNLTNQLNHPLGQQQQQQQQQQASSAHHLGLFPSQSHNQTEFNLIPIGTHHNNNNNFNNNQNFGHSNFQSHPPFPPTHHNNNNNNNNNNQRSQFSSNSTPNNHPGLQPTDSQSKDSKTGFLQTSSLDDAPPSIISRYPSIHVLVDTTNPDNFKFILPSNCVLPEPYYLDNVMRAIHVKLQQHRAPTVDTQNSASSEVKTCSDDVLDPLDPDFESSPPLNESEEQPQQQTDGVVVASVAPGGSNTHQQSNGSSAATPVASTSLTNNNDQNGNKRIPPPKPLPSGSPSQRSQHGSQHGSTTSTSVKPTHIPSNSSTNSRTNLHSVVNPEDIKSHPTTKPVTPALSASTTSVNSFALTPSSPNQNPALTNTSSSNLSNLQSILLDASSERQICDFFIRAGLNSGINMCFKGNDCKYHHPALVAPNGGKSKQICRLYLSDYGCMQTTTCSQLHPPGRISSVLATKLGIKHLQFSAPLNNQRVKLRDTLTADQLAALKQYESEHHESLGESAMQLQLQRSQHKQQLRQQQFKAQISGSGELSNKLKSDGISANLPPISSPSSYTTNSTDTGSGNGSLNSNPLLNSNPTLPGLININVGPVNNGLNNFNMTQSNNTVNNVNNLNTGMMNLSLLPLSPLSPVSQQSQSQQQQQQQQQQNGGFNAVTGVVSTSGIPQGGSMMFNTTPVDFIQFQARQQQLHQQQQQQQQFQQQQFQQQQPNNQTSGSHYRSQLPGLITTPTTSFGTLSSQSSLNSNQHDSASTGFSILDTASDVLSVEPALSASSQQANGDYRGSDYNHSQLYSSNPNQIQQFAKDRRASSSSNQHLQLATPQMNAGNPHHHIGNNNNTNSAMYTSHQGSQDFRQMNSKKQQGHHGYHHDGENINESGGALKDDGALPNLYQTQSSRLHGPHTPQFCHLDEEYSDNEYSLNDMKNDQGYLGRNDAYSVSHASHTASVTPSQRSSGSQSRSQRGITHTNTAGNSRTSTPSATPAISAINSHHSNYPPYGHGHSKNPSFSSEFSLSAHNNNFSGSFSGSHASKGSNNSGSRGQTNNSNAQLIDGTTMNNNNNSNNMGGLSNANFAHQSNGNLHHQHGSLHQQPAALSYHDRPYAQNRYDQSTDEMMGMNGANMMLMNSHPQTPSDNNQMNSHHPHSQIHGMNHGDLVQDSNGLLPNGYLPPYLQHQPPY